MTSKEKLEMLWKYLLLVVLVYGFTQMGRSHRPMVYDHKFGGSTDHGMMLMGDDFKDMDIQVEVDHDGNDSTMTVTINGETIDIDNLEDFDVSKLDGDHNSHVFVKKIKSKGKTGEHQIKVIKKEIVLDK